MHLIFFDLGRVFLSKAVFVFIAFSIYKRFHASELRWIMFEGIEPSFFEESAPGLK